MRFGRLLPVAVLSALVLLLCLIYARTGGDAPTSPLPLTPDRDADAVLGEGEGGVSVEVLRPPTDSSAREGATNADPVIAVYDADKRTLVNMKLEEYLIGVVAAEMPADYPAEALKAQAVAARTYAVQKSAWAGGEGCSNHSGADVCTDSAHCQAYMGEAARKTRWGDRFNTYETAVTGAVEGTRGLIAAYEGVPILALFHASSGGRTEDAAAAFSQSVPYLKAVESKGEEDYKNYTSAHTFTKSAFVKLVNKAYPKAALKADSLSKQVKIASLTPSGRVDTLKLGGVIITGRQARKLLGLNSTDFTIKMGEGVTFACKGYGHGVGMSQAGARALALGGADYASIITHYYTGVTLERMGDVIDVVKE